MIGNNVKTLAEKVFLEISSDKDTAQSSCILAE